MNKLATVSLILVAILFAAIASRAEATELRDDGGIQGKGQSYCYIHRDEGEIGVWYYWDDESGRIYLASQVTYWMSSNHKGYWFRDVDSITVKIYRFISPHFSKLVQSRTCYT